MIIVLLTVSKYLFVFSLILIGLSYFDIRSMLLNIKRNKDNSGSSGIPFIALLLYMIGIWLLPNDILGIYKGYLFYILVFIHLCCHFIVPFIHKLYIK